jgi:hypothetical protein
LTDGPMTVNVYGTMEGANTAAAMYRVDGAMENRPAMPRAAVGVSIGGLDRSARDIL